MRMWVSAARLSPSGWEHNRSSLTNSPRSWTRWCSVTSSPSWRPGWPAPSWRSGSRATATCCRSADASNRPTSKTRAPEHHQTSPASFRLVHSRLSFPLRSSEKQKKHTRPILLPAYTLLLHIWSESVKRYLDVSTAHNYITPASNYPSITVKILWGMINVFTFIFDLKNIFFSNLFSLICISVFNF